ncbi:DUF1810 domain-containing protein [Methylobacterium sp. R2-1]|uniref:DUF1810 domain-containing protein n=1 Tax=Methylobacterium sp. R2-1 TaxID=2587064 RepID=UPI00161FBFD4|nr:DUF1810 domain-containing protein [Methylobacterium sp. R2-1]MBB2963798.1 uncharacterized protein (DUF1810 family) [Methylobacterium sp. R2-1]
MMEDAFGLNRFVEAQDSVYESALAELRSGRKRSHWMWFIFPQLAGLGSSAMARRYAIGSLAEAQAYLAHPLLGERLRICTRAANACEDRSAHALFGAPDDVKFRSSMTLFARADPKAPDFARALATFFDGQPDPLTLEKLSQR